jgi:GMP synthase-like glutamine amidotransferase
MDEAMPVVACLHHLEQPFLGHAEGPLRAAGLALDERCLPAGDPLPDLSEVDGIVSFGGAQSAVDLGADPVLAAEADLLRSAVDRGVPVLGICLGGQVLARALGGTVVAARRRAVTWRELTPRDPGDPLFGGHGTVPALHWNEDVFTLPPGAVEVLGAPEPEGVEAFRYGERAWGVQFHPEVDADALDGWYARYGDWLGQAGVDEHGARALDARWLDRQAQFSAQLFAAFAAQVSQVRSPRTPAVVER